MIDLTERYERAFDQDVEPDEPQSKQNVNQRVRDERSSRKCSQQIHVGSGKIA